MKKKIENKEKRTNELKNKEYENLIKKKDNELKLKEEELIKQNINKKPEEIKKYEQNKKIEFQNLYEKSDDILDVNKNILQEIKNKTYELKK